MKIETNATGWVITKAEKFEIKLIKRNFSSLKSWIDFNSKHPDIGKRRLTCNMCNKAWVEMPVGSEIHICMMKSKHNNQVICDGCLKKLDQSLIINPL